MVNVVVALAIVVGTLLVFMGLRSGILMGGILLVTVAGTLFGMYLYGLDMQRISLGALIIALGMLVDNAIVVVEGTLVKVERGEDAAKAAREVVGQTRWPLLGGTIVGILAFSPIGFFARQYGRICGQPFLDHRHRPAVLMAGGDLADALTIAPCCLSGGRHRATRKKIRFLASTGACWIWRSGCAG